MFILEEIQSLSCFKAKKIFCIEKSFLKSASLSKYYLLIEEKQDNYMAQFQTNYPNDLTPKSEKVNLQPFLSG